MELSTLISIAATVSGLNIFGLLILVWRASNWHSLTKIHDGDIAKIKADITSIFKTQHEIDLQMSNLHNDIGSLRKDMNHHLGNLDRGQALIIEKMAEKAADDRVHRVEQEGARTRSMETHKEISENMKRQSEQVTATLNLIRNSSGIQSMEP